jgi:formamidopyrimidine-DNA glycosylase
VPELPDITVYVECLQRRVVGATLQQLKLRSPFVLRTVLPPWRDVLGKKVTGVRRLAKRIVFELSDELRMVIHLMRLGRFRWADPGGKAIGGKILLATFGFDTGTLYYTETGTKKRASLHVVAGDAAVDAFDRGGIDPLTCSREAFADALPRENHTLKRSLTDQRLLAGIGNAYSDEILHAAKLSPMKGTRSLAVDDIARLFEATQRTLEAWIERTRDEVGEGFPEKVTAFRSAMAVHGKFGKPCPVCGSAVQRIVYATNECNYCATCQTGGRLLSDRALARLLRQDWPRTLEELEARKRTL